MSADAAQSASHTPPPLPRFRWRAVPPGEIDAEQLCLGVSLGALLIGGVWIALRFPTPPCVFKALTGCPCATCGATRAVFRLARGDWAAAFLFNPLVTLTATAVLLFNGYALVVLAGGLPRLRLVRPFTGWQGHAWRAILFLAVAANWAWVIARGN